MRRPFPGVNDRSGRRAAAAVACAILALAALVGLAPSLAPTRQPAVLSPGPILILPAPAPVERPATRPTSPATYCAGLPCAPDPVYPPQEHGPKPPLYCAGLACGGEDPTYTTGPGAPTGRGSKSIPLYCAGFDCGLSTGPSLPPGAGTSPGTPCLSMNGCGGGGDLGTPNLPGPRGPIHQDPVCAGVACGLQANEPVAGRDRPAKGPPPCMGLNCPGVEPPQKEYRPTCFSCGVSKALQYWAGPGAPSTTQHPVDLATGYKLETATDLVVPLPGPDFVLSRSYSSQVAMSGGTPSVDTNLGLPPYSGWHWALNLTACLYVNGYAAQDMTPPPYIALSTPSGTTLFLYNGNSSAPAWNPTGGSTQSILHATLTVGSATIPVWRLVEPGAWVVDFDARNSVASGTMGLPLQERDAYGHLRTFEYSGVGTTAGPRLAHIYLGSDAESGSHAVVDLTWNTDGRLEKAEVFRTPSTAKTLVSKAVYTYFAASQGYSSDVGSVGDLIQVDTWQPVDRSEDTASGSQLWHVTTTQYRYYTGAEGQPGKAHQLKSVIEAQQVEFAAQRSNASGAAAWNTVKTYAASLLAKADTDTAFTDGSTAVTVRELCAKVIVSYDSGDRVTAQDLQTGCGCSGGGSFGTRETYEHVEWPSAAGRTLVVHENTKDGSGAWTPVRTRFHDLTAFFVTAGTGTFGGSYLSSSATGLGDGSSAPYWATRIDYSTSTSAPERRITALYGPSGISSYTPATTSAAPTVTAAATSGYHLEYTYTTEGRLATTAIVRHAATPVSSILSRTTYDSSRPWLPSRSELATKEGMSASDMDSSGNADFVQRTDITYGFYTSLDPNLDSAVSWMQLRFEAETVRENGPGGWYVSHTLFDEGGSPVFARVADDSLVKRTFDAHTGAVLTIEANAPSTGISSMPHPTAVSGEFGWDGRNSSGGSLAYSMTYDLAGRLRTLTMPGGAVNRYTRELRSFPSHLSSGDGRPGVLYFCMVGLPMQVPGTDEEPVFTSPANVTWSDAGGALVGSCDYVASAKDNQYGGIFTSWPYAVGSSPLARQSVQASLAGQVSSSTVWHDMDGHGDGNGRYVTGYSYDAEGRLRQTLAPNRTIARTFYDQLGRVDHVEEGACTSGGDPDAATTYLLATYRYDGATTSTLVSGDSLVTRVVEETGESSPATRTTDFLHDWRGRLAAVTNPVAPHAVLGYDNLGRVAESASLSTAVTAVTAPSADSIASTRLAYASASYSQRGMPYRSRIALVPTSTSIDDPDYDNYAESHSWYDPAGRIVGAWGPSAPMVKNSIDGLGRASATYVVDRDTDADPGASGNYADVFDRSTYTAVLAKNVVLETAVPQYRSGGGFLDLVRSQARLHTLADSVKGDIDSSTKSITTWTALEYDRAGRHLRTLDFGTNLTSGFNGGGTAPTSSGTPLAWSGNTTPLVSGVEYDQFGRPAVSFALKDSGPPLKSKSFYDATGAVVGTIDNWTGAELEWSTTLGHLELTGADPTKPDENQAASVRPRITESTPAVDQIAYTFTLSGSTWTQEYQVTRTSFGVTIGTGSTDSRITSNDLVAQVAYPGMSGAPSGSDKRLFAYNRQGETRWKKDQRGVEHLYTLDAGGRLTLDDASGGGSETDAWADAVSISYDSNGRAYELKTLKHNASPDPDTVLNAVRMHYSALGLLDQFDQNPLGELTYTGTTPTGTTRRVGYSYDAKDVARGNWIRPTATAYPSGDSLAIAYGTSGSTTSSRISRATKIGAGFAFTPAAVEYQFLGVATPVAARYAGPHVKLDRAMAQDGSTATGQYPCVDSFGRVTRQLWVDDGYTTGSVSGFADRPAIVDTTYSYTRLGALTSKLDARPGATMLANHAYTLDGLLRLLEDQRGTAGFPSGGAKPGSQQFAYDLIGNLPQTKTDTSDAGSFSTGGSGTTALSGGAFDLVNQVTGGTYTPPASTTAQTMSYSWDAAGNLGSRSIAGDASHSWQYRHDRWGRLTQADFMDGTTAQPALRAQYNGLSMRCVVDRAPDSWVPPAAPSITERRLGYFDASWQLLEEHVDHDAPLATSGGDIDEVDQYVWGLRHIDDLVLRRVNANYAGGADTDYTDTSGGDRVGDQYLSDTQFSVVASIDSGGALLERVEYDAYGQASHHWPEGITGAPGGGVVSADATAASGAVGKSIGQSGYLADADLNRDGTVTTAEANAISAKVGTAGLPAGRISAYGSTVGWCGYAFNPGTNLYTVRFRHFDPAPAMQRWLERDPAGYMDGASLYCYYGIDPSGLSILDARWHHLIPRATEIQELLTPGLLKFMHQAVNGYILPKAVHDALHEAGYNAWAKGTLERLLADPRLQGEGVFVAFRNAVLAHPEYSRFLAAGAPAQVAWRAWKVSQGLEMVAVGARGLGYLLRPLAPILAIAAPLMWVDLAFSAPRIIDSVIGPYAERSVQAWKARRNAHAQAQWEAVNRGYKGDQLDQDLKRRSGICDE